MKSHFLMTSRLFSSVLFLTLSGLLLACNQATQTPAVVKVVKQDNQYSLTVNGQPYNVKGVGLGYKNDEKVIALKEAGGNTFRTWNLSHIEQELVIAEKLGLMVAVGIKTGKELLGFDYNDEEAVAEQFKQVTAAIEKYKNHPNVLMWVINNEPNLLFDEQGKLKQVNTKVYAAMGDIIDYIHKHDPNHPATFSLAGANPKDIAQVLQYAPNIDILSVQTYGDLVTLPASIATSNVDKPYMVTEFGPMGHWELPTTEWEREIEEPSAVKAAGMAKRMQDVILEDKTGKIIGSFAFFWGQKQERTPTWYGMFNESGEQTARIDELTRMWTGQYPANRAPLSKAILINDKQAVENIHLKAGQPATVKVQVMDPDGDPLTHEWVLMKEVETRSQGGHFEAKPAELALQILKSDVQTDSVEMTFNAPDEAGEYRLFNYAHDGKNKVGNANIPFMVEN
ncbi:glycoside hydrolase family 2 TIM barrel-domain containing protein [uncultured Paraglaciecola sp.]|uniref:glycoside hydrolase family 2 TIM barrel-domain containing protein n=1 Tax=uncultured Paraglaciecola sp. TaxID=1765024 RepID=UPI0030DB85AD|tara:strand:- start:15246 stop:16604 length:1359 start_codon:yes stop_codon:yes gene_type:complete